MSNRTLTNIDRRLVVRKRCLITVVAVLGLLWLVSIVFPVQYDGDRWHFELIYGFIGGSCGYPQESTGWSRYRDDANRTCGMLELSYGPGLMQDDGDVGDVHIPFWIPLTFIALLAGVPIAHRRWTRARTKSAKEQRRVWRSLPAVGAATLFAAWLFSFRWDVMLYRGHYSLGWNEGALFFEGGRSLHGWSPWGSYVSEAGVEWIKRWPMLHFDEDSIIIDVPFWLLFVSIWVVGRCITSGMTHPRQDVLCCRCGYNLTGNVSGMCPECATPVPEEIRRIVSATQPEGTRHKTET